ncbi:MAG: transcription elongation factor GreA [Bacilli bacterium]|nr:transcription elongation factor GreA [Bacilli bacterium]
MMNKKYTLTEEGLKAIKDEYEQLKIDRDLNIKAIQDARSQGDLSENADYDAARDDQAKIQNRISQIEKILKNYELIGDETNNLGKWVKIEFLDLEDEDEPIQIYKIVGTLEADPLRQLISNESPLGLAIVNHHAGDKVYVKTENGEEFYVKIHQVSSREIKK